MKLEAHYYMKYSFTVKGLFIIALMMLCMSVHAQYSSSNSYTRRALVMYEKGPDGFYKRMTDKMLDKVSGLTATYAYDKKAQILYVLTETANCAVTLYKDYAKIIKKDESIKQLKGDELKAEINSRTKYLDDKYKKINEQRAQFIQDSIAKVKADSIAHVRALKKQAADRKAAEDNYRNTHSWHWTPTKNVSLSCSDCDKSFTEDSVWCFGIKNDSIYFITTETGDLDIDHLVCHEAKIPVDLATDKDFLYHYRIFKDSLTRDSLDYQEGVYYLNMSNEDKYLQRIKNIAPYGFFESWGWDDEYSNITFNFRYTNTNPKTIRYITVYFKVTNDVGDVRKTGYFKGTGPLKQWESASWNWDSSFYYVSGDATKMNITKVVLTWMNGKQQVVSGRYLQFNSSDD